MHKFCRLKQIFALTNGMHPAHVIVVTCKTVKAELSYLVNYM